MSHANPLGLVFTPNLVGNHEHVNIGMKQDSWPSIKKNLVINSWGTLVSYP